jgi:hypothetical protein
LYCLPLCTPAYSAINLLTNIKRYRPNILNFETAILFFDLELVDDDDDEDEEDDDEDDDDDDEEEEEEEDDDDDQAAHRKGL